MNSDPGRLPDQGKSHEAAETVVLDWWRSAIAGDKAPAGPRAELRRAKTLEEVVFVPLFHELRHGLATTQWHSIGRLSLVAGVLAHVREHDPSKPFAAQMAAPRSGSAGGPRVAPSRFRRLLRFEESNEGLDQLFALTRRVIALLDNRANVTDLARSLYWWNARTRKRWAIDYYDHVNERSLKKD
jgi:CRISPR system Cascade subunit CasB